MDHIVQANDTPYTLAKKYVNDGNRWPELCKANPKLPKHPDWGCVFTVGKAVTLPEAWAQNVIGPAAPPAPIPGPVPQPIGPAIPTPDSALAPSSPGIFGSLEPKTLMIGAAAVAGLVVIVYASKRKKAAHA